MHDIYIGIDNGVSGTIGVISNKSAHSAMLVNTPVKLQQDYTKKKKNLNRLDVILFESILEMYKQYSCMAILERPMVNPQMFQATMSAVRCMEAQLCVLESYGIGHMFIDSKEWQKVMLPHGVKGKAELKKASMDIGIRLFPQFKERIEKQKDADGILIAEWARRQQL